MKDTEEATAAAAASDHDCLEPLQSKPAGRRRDPRFRLRQASAHVEFADPTSERGVRRAALVCISVAGLTLELDEPFDNLRVGTALEAVTVRVARCELHGDIVIKNSRSLGGSTIEVGCLFYPAADQIAERLMAVIAGIDAAQPD